MIISIRGTNGSGKSTAMRAVMAMSDPPPRPVWGRIGPRLPEAYEMFLHGVPAPVWVLGPYTTSQQGGCDLIKPYDNILALIEQYAEKGHVLFEGVLVSSSNGRVGELMEQWGKESVMIFLTTDLETCIANVASRRDESGLAPKRNASLWGGEVVVKGREQDPTNLTDKFKSVARSLEVIRAKNVIRVEEASAQDTPALMLELLRGALW